MSDRRSLTLAAVAAVVAVAIGVVLSYVIRWFPVQASVQAHNTDRLYRVLVIASIPIFVLVTTVILYSVWRFRMKPGEELKDGPPIHGNTRLEVFWTALPTVLLLGLVSYSFVILHENEKKPANEIQIGVTGQQFAWTYEYPPALTRGKAVTSYDLYIPKGRSVEFNIRAKDVIHAFWVPAFRLQEDAVPGVTTHWRVTATRTGTYPVICNLLCGLGHSLMRSSVHVVSQSRFEAFVAGLRGASAASGAGGASGTGSAG